MFELTIKSSFSAAHRLINYKGKCENLHGHNWKVQVSIAAKELDNQGMVIDFRKIKQKLNRILVKLDHGYLNEISYFKKCNTTSEHIARYIYLELTGLIKKKGLRVEEVTVWETDTSSATYRPNNLTI